MFHPFLLLLLAVPPASILGHPLSTWEHLTALQSWLLPVHQGATTGPLPVRRPIDEKQPALYRDGVAASIEVLVDDHLNGSGFIVSGGGYAMTAAHVVQTPGRVEARTLYGRVPADVVAVDLGHDLALLKLRPLGPSVAWPTLELAETAPVAGTPIFLLGTPIYRHHVLLQGVVARAETTFEYLPDEERYVRVMHVSGMSPPGTSGSPWMLADGRVVGVTSGHMLFEGSFVGVSFVGPIDAMRALVRRLEDARTPSLGVAVEEIWEQQYDFLRQFPPSMEGLVVVILVPGGPGQAAGLRIHDLITHIDGQRVIERDDLLTYVRNQTVGATVALTVQHPGEGERTVQVGLDALELRTRPGRPTRTQH